MIRIERKSHLADYESLWLAAADTYAAVERKDSFGQRRGCLTVLYLIAVAALVAATAQGVCILSTRELSSIRASKAAHYWIHLEDASTPLVELENFQMLDVEEGRRLTTSVAEVTLNTLHPQDGSSLLGRRLLQDSGGRLPFIQPTYYEDYYCTDPGYNCEYYDYGVNIEGTGSLGILENVLLDQVNALSNVTPRLAARARADSAVVSPGNVSVSATRRNTTVVVQNQPSRTAGLYTTGAVGVDASNVTALSAGTATAVAKNIVAIGFPVNNYASSGEAFVVTNAEGSGVRNLTRAQRRDAAVRSLVGGLSVAGNRAVATTTGTFSVGPVIGIFNAGNRAGASSQNGVFSQSIGRNSSAYLQSSSLGVISPGNPAIAAKMMKEMEAGDKNAKDNNNYIEDTMNLPSKVQQQLRQDDVANLDSGGAADANYGQTDGKIPFQDYYYYDEGEGGQPGQTNAAGGVSKGWMYHQDLAELPSTRPFNTRGEQETFGAANGFGWTRGVSQNELLATGTRSSGARLRAGAFGTGASTITASVGSVTDLPEVVLCKYGRNDQKGQSGTAKDCRGSGEVTTVWIDDEKRPANATSNTTSADFTSIGKPGDGGKKEDGVTASQLEASLLKGASQSGAGASQAQSNVDDDSDLLTPELRAMLDNSMFSIPRPSLI